MLYYQINTVIHLFSIFPQPAMQILPPPRRVKVSPLHIDHWTNQRDLPFPQTRRSIIEQNRGQKLEN